MERTNAFIISGAIVLGAFIIALSSRLDSPRPKGAHEALMELEKEWHWKLNDSEERTKKLRDQIAKLEASANAISKKHDEKLMQVLNVTPTLAPWPPKLQVLPGGKVWYRWDEPTSNNFADAAGLIFLSSGTGAFPIVVHGNLILPRRHSGDPWDGR